VTLLDLLGIGGGGTAPSALPVSATPTTPQEAKAYRTYQLACMENGMPPKPYPEWVKAGRPPT
jgi:hypothetical protein